MGENLVVFADLSAYMCQAPELWAAVMAGASLAARYSIRYRYARKTYSNVVSHRPTARSAPRLTISLKGDFDWSKIFAARVRWFHSGGIFGVAVGDDRRADRRGNQRGQDGRRDYQLRS